MRAFHAMASPWPGLIAAGIAVLGCLVMVLAAAGVSFALDVGPLHISLRSIRNPAIAMVVSGVLAAAWLGSSRVAGPSRRLHALIHRRAGLLAAVVAAALAFSAASCGAFVAGGSDSSGYVSQARLWNQGTFRVRPATIEGVDFSAGLNAVIPLGYRPAGGADGAMAPVYPPGLPALMAAFQSVAGAGAEFWVVPLAAGILVLATYRVGSLVAGPEAGLLSAVAIATSPTVLFQAFQPMSDVPSAAAWTLAVALLLEATAAATTAAGMAAAVACLIRPNLFTLIPLLAFAAWRWEPQPGRRLLRVSLATVPPLAAGLALAAWQRALYGGTTETGYGSVGSLFQLNHIWPNLARYPQWLFESHGLFILLAIAGPTLLRRGAGAPVMSRTGAVMVARWAAWTCLALVAFYLLYIPFDGWAYTRFLLPVLPLAVILSAIALVAFVAQAPQAFRTLTFVAILILVPCLLLSRARSLFVFEAIAAEQRYVDAAQYVDTLPPSAVLLSMHHSGSLAFYTRRPIVRWDRLDSSELDDVAAALSGRGHDVYAVLDGWEVPEFVARFPDSLSARLGPPVYGAVPADNSEAVVFLVRAASR